LRVYLAVHPKTYHQAGLRRGNRHLKFHEDWDNLRAGVRKFSGSPATSEVATGTIREPTAGIS